MIQVDSELGVKLGVGYGNRPILSIGIREQLTLNQRATGSIPVRPTTFSSTYEHPAVIPPIEKTVLDLFLGDGLDSFPF